MGRIVAQNRPPRFDTRINRGGWKWSMERCCDASLRANLGSNEGAALVGYDPEIEYTANSVGKAIGPFKAENDMHEMTKEARAAVTYGIYDFSEYPVDAGAAANSVITQIRGEADPRTLILRVAR
ncbi:hypothetical protein DDT52_17210 [Brenneria roseae subsp. roseae]|nr:hypothetical protein DDT52_17210 [Brenneria roseae subsp. roseae]